MGVQRQQPAVHTQVYNQQFTLSCTISGSHSGIQSAVHTQAYNQQFILSSPKATGHRSKITMQSVTRAAEWVYGNHRHGIGSHVIEGIPSLSYWKVYTNKNDQPWVRVCTRVLSAHGNEWEPCFSALRRLMVWGKELSRSAVGGDCCPTRS